MHEIFSESKMTDFNRTNTFLSGKMDVKKSGIMYLSIPNYNNMNIYVDGHIVDHFDYLHGTGIDLDVGKHEIKIEGKLTTNISGNVISIISILVLIAYIFIKKQNIHKKEEAKEK